MGRRDVIVIGASAGGVDALRALVGRLPEDLPATVLVVLHVPPDARSALPEILRRAGKLEVASPAGEPVLTPGTIFVAPPDHHMTVCGGTIRLSRGPRINRHRPAIDPLFVSAARSVGSRVMGVILSGALDDGTAGMLAVKRAGGVTLVQDPREAVHRGMPLTVLEHMEVDHVLPAAELGTMLARLATELDHGASLRGLRLPKRPRSRRVMIR